MYIDFLLDAFKESGKNEAIVWKNKTYDYNWLLDRINYWIAKLQNNNIGSGKVVALTADFSPEGIALLLALMNEEAIIAPFTNTSRLDNSRKYEIAQIECFIDIDQDDDKLSTIRKTGIKADHEFYTILRNRNVPGLVMFTSGTSGEPKAAVHDFSKLLDKFRVKRKSLKTVNFLLFDHWGGLNTLLHTLSNTGIVLATTDRSPDGICSYIEKQGIELLPASPTFFNLLFMSEAWKRYNLSSLRLITYGAEPMPETTLKRLKKIFPDVRLQQTYGLIELGVLRSKSKSDDSLWVKVGGEGFNLRVVDGILQIKSHSAMLGYMNAPSPFTEDGWYITGDAVETDGEYLKILGRKSELINVGGEKVYPTEVESIIQEMDNILEVKVFGEKNPITGSIVCASVRLENEENRVDLTKRIKLYCKDKLQSFKIPVKIKIEEQQQFGERYKKVRKP